MTVVSFLPGCEVIQELRKRIRSSEKSKVAIAHLGKKGFDAILRDLIETLMNGNKVDLIVGISPSSMTDREALDWLCNLSKDFKDSLTVGYFNTERFHPKLFLFEKGEKRTAVIGSSNLTGAGLGENIEANLLVEGVATEEVFRDVSRFFDTLWTGRDEFTDEVAKLYKSRKSSQRSRLTIPRTSTPPTVSSGVRTLGDLLARFGKDHFFMMHLSYNGDEKERLWRFAVRNEMIGLSRNNIRGDWAKIRDSGIDLIDGTWIYQFDRFCRCGPNEQEGMDSGDIVVILAGQDYVLGVGQVTGMHEYRSELRRLFFDHVRPVAWKQLFDYNMRRKIERVEGFTNTLKRVDPEQEKEAWRILTALNMAR